MKKITRYVILITIASIIGIGLGLFLHRREIKCLMKPSLLERCVPCEQLEVV